MNRYPHRRRFRPRIVAALLALISSSVMLAVGCSDDTVSEPQSPCAGFDLTEVVVDDLVGFGNLVVEDVPFDEMQLLYFGTQGGESSSLLLRYDFAAAAAALEDVFPDSVFYQVQNNDTTWEYQHILREDLISAENIERVELRFYFPKDLAAADKSVVVEEVAAQLDPSLYPNEEVPATDRVVGSEVNFNTTGTDFITLDETRFLEWWQVGTHNGLLVSEADDGLSDDGLVAVASKENRFGASAFDCIDDDTVLGPVLIVYLVHPTESEAQDEDYGHSIVILPSADLATMDALDPVSTDPTDGFTMRTHLRSYPYFCFDPAGVPPEVTIDSAFLWVGLDTTASYGFNESLVVSEVDSAFVATSGGVVTLGDFAGAARVCDGRNLVDPGDSWNRRLYFDVTESCRRLCRAEGDEAFRFILSAGEDCFGAYDMTTMDPDFFLNRFEFEGMAAPDSLRPRLVIRYCDAQAGS